MNRLRAGCGLLLTLLLSACSGERPAVPAPDPALDAIARTERHVVVALGRDGDREPLWWGHQSLLVEATGQVGSQRGRLPEVLTALLRDGRTGTAATAQRPGYRYGVRLMDARGGTLGYLYLAELQNSIVFVGIDGRRRTWRFQEDAEGVPLPTADLNPVFAVLLAGP